MAKDSRLYATFTVNFLEHPKIAPLSIEAKLGFIEMVLWCRDQLTDGRIPVGYARHRWTETVLDELSTNHPDRPTLTRVGGGDYIIHDFAEHQITTKQISELRKAEISRARAAAGRASGEARRNKAANKTANKIEQTPNKAEQPPEQTPAETARKPQVNTGIGLNKPTNANTELEIELEIPSGYLVDDRYVSRVPEFIDNAARPSPRHPTSAALTLVRQELPSVYPRRTNERLAVQVDKLLAQRFPDTFVRRCVRAWDEKRDCDKPEFLETVASDLIKSDRARNGLSRADEKGLKWLALGRQQPPTQELTQ